MKREIDEELRSHLERRIADNVAAGMSLDQAAREVRKRFGNFESVREECRDTRGANWGESFCQDTRFALRILRKNPGLTTIAVLTLALGIGANTTMFSLVNLVVFRPLTFPDADRLVRIFRVSNQSPRDGLSVGVFMDLREQNTVFDSVASYCPEWPYNFAEPGQPAELLSGMLVTADFFSTLGVQPELGRAFTREEDQPGRDDVVVLSHEFWQQQYRGDTNIVGRTVRLDGRDATIVGVMPKRFRDVLLWQKVDLLHPFAFGSPQRENRGGNWRFAFGRLKPGTTVAQADAELKALAARFAQQFPKTEAGYGLRAVLLRDSISEDGGPILWTSLGLAGFVLLIACGNVASLLLARLTARSHELAIRAAVGAGRGRLLRQLLAESFVLSLIGGCLGLLLAVWANDLVGSRLTVGGETGIDLPIDGRVFGFAFVCCVLAAVLAGMAPAWWATRRHASAALAAGSTRTGPGTVSHRWRSALIIGDVSLALVLLTGAGLFLRGLDQYAHRDPGWRVDGLMTAQLDLTPAQYRTPDSRRQFFQELESRLDSFPGVRSVAFSSRPPILTSRFHQSIAFEGRPLASPGQQFFAGMEPVTPNYFETVGIQLKRGRLFNAADDANHPDVAVVNETMARRCWPNDDPIGKRIRIADSTPSRWQEIVGVVTDVRLLERGGEPEPQVYRPLAQDPPQFAHAEIRFSGAPESIAAAVRHEVQAIDPDQSTYKIITAREFIRRELNDISLLGGVLASFAALGLTLAAVGIYGVVSYTVVQRTGEIGVRMALGAPRAHVLWLVLRQGLELSLVGAVLGSAGAVGMARLVAAVVPFPVPASARTLVAVASFLIVVALLACLLPARRASRVDPLTALRYE